MPILITITSLLIIILGGLGSVLPVLPGVPLSFAGLWLYAWFSQYQVVTVNVLVIFAILTALTVVLDLVAPALGAKGFKASKIGVIGAFVGAFMGAFALGPIGIILGPFIGAFVGEYIAKRNAGYAFRVAWGSFIGFIVSSIVKLAVVVAMLGVVIYSLFNFS